MSSRTLSAFMSLALSACVLTACTVENRAPGRTSSGAPSAPAVVNAPDGLVTGTRGDADSLLVDVRSLDSTIVVDLRYRDSLNFTGAPLPGYAANRALAHRDVALALARVQSHLRPQGLGLKIWDAYRPIRATRAMVEWATRVDRESLITDGYIADRSRHNLGIAVDCTLISLETGKALDMGTPFDTFDSTAHTANAVGAVAENRLRFVTVMASEGFLSYDREWWHYTFRVSSPMRFDIVIQ